MLNQGLVEVAEERFSALRLPLAPYFLRKWRLRA